MRRRFENRTALVIGGANGIGENLVRRLVDEGALVAVADIEREALATLCADMPGKVLGVVCDVSDKKSVDAAVETIVGHYGRIDVSFCNAGIARFSSFLNISLDDWNRVLSVNLTGMLLAGQAVARAMIRQGTGGVIVNTSSMLSTRVTANTGAYCPSKAGVSSLTRLMSLELAPHNIRVNAVAPGPTATRINSAIRADAGKYQQRVVKLAAGRFARPDEMSSVMLFLASDEASYVHGATYMVDSGYTTN